MTRLVVADSSHVERIYRESHVLWGAGLTRRDYLELWNASAKYTIDFDEAWHTHRIHAAYTVLACCQIVTFPEDISDPQRQFTNAFLARAEAAVKDLDALSALRERGLA